MKYTKYILFITSFFCLLFIGVNANAHVKYTTTPKSLRGTWIGKSNVINSKGSAGPKKSSL